MFIGFLLSNKLNTNLNLHYSIIIFLINYIILNLISKIIERITKKETILGAGDILLISTLCEFLIPNKIFIFYIIIGLFGIIYILINNKHIIPLVPVISLSFLVVNLI
jgi:nitrate/nitrite transporter NarK